MSSESSNAGPESHSSTGRSKRQRTSDGELYDLGSARIELTEQSMVESSHPLNSETHSEMGFSYEAVEKSQVSLEMHSTAGSNKSPRSPKSTPTPTTDLVATPCLESGNSTTGTSLPEIKQEADSNGVKRKFDNDICPQPKRSPKRKPVKQQILVYEENRMINAPLGLKAIIKERAESGVEMTSSQLLGISRDKSYVGRRNRRPWGLQRALTFQKVKDRAEGLGQTIPVITDDTVQKYCVHSDRGTFHPMHSTLPIENVDIRVLGGIELSAEELLTFFPRHLLWPDMLYRLSQNGWESKDVLNYINFTRGFVLPEAITYATMAKWKRDAKNAILSNFSKNRCKWRTTCFTVTGWEPRKYQFIEGLLDYFLVDLMTGVQHLPEGDGARLLTRAVRLAHRRGDKDIRLGQIHEYIRKNLLIFPLLPSLIGQLKSGKHPDMLSLERVKTTLKRAAAAKSKDVVVGEDVSVPVVPK
ncbi:hypothetical protein GQ44DRAFT_796859 [Phaeosphaeriaceae sp. PMI808]|nr:hypothetical protein GQ44DRAFT_796859 [Phaeosphaeriaceae sp. PMI808]